MRKLLIFSAGIFLIAAFLAVSQTLEGKVAGFTFFSADEQSAPSYTFPKPEEVVQQYFEAWNRKDYASMYSTFSDGFRKIDENAKTLDDFRKFVDEQGIAGVKIVGLRLVSNNGITASVDYSVEFTLTDGSKQPFSGTYTLKFRTGDIIRGWKLIHPYGKNIDTSEENVSFEEMCRNNGHQWMTMPPMKDGKSLGAAACAGCMVGSNHLCALGEYLQVLNK